MFNNDHEKTNSVNENFFWLMRILTGCFILSESTHSQKKSSTTSSRYLFMAMSFLYLLQKVEGTFYLDQLSTNQGITLTGATGDNAGRSLNKVGDVDGDGKPDFLIGAQGHASNTGAAYLIFGRNDFTHINSLASLGNNGVTITSSSCSSCFIGVSTNAAGDVNGDGYPDFLIGGSGTIASTGIAYLLYGGPHLRNRTTIDLASLGNLGISITSNNCASCQIGWSVSAAGDVNGDNYADFLVGAKGYSSSTGAAYLIYGSHEPTSIDVATLGNKGIRITSSSCSGCLIGYSLSAVNDVDHDGYVDFLVGAPFYASRTGAVYLISGGPNLTNVTNIDLALGNKARKITSSSCSNCQMGVSVSYAGDMNGDNIPDFLVGAYGYAANTGVAFLIFGKSGLSNIDTLSLGSAGINITSSSCTGCNIGWSISSAGDVNGDGKADIFVGGYGTSSFTGAAYLIYGKNTLSNINLASLSNNGLQITSASCFNCDIGNSISVLGDVNNDGYSDVLIGALGYSSNTGKVFLLYGGQSGLITNYPTSQPSSRPSNRPSAQPSRIPTQPTGQPTGQPVSQPTEQPTDQPVSQPTGQPTGKPVSQPTGQPTDQPVSQPTEQPTDQPVSQPTGQPTGKPVSQPTGQPTGKPVSQPTEQPTDQPVSQPTGQPTGKPVSQPTEQPTDQPVSQPTGQPTGKPASQPTGQPTGQPVSQPTEQPTGQPVNQPTEQPTGQPVSQPTEQPTGQPVSQPTEQPTGQPVSQPTEQPTGQPVSQPTGQPTGKPVSQPTEQPVGQPTGGPTDRPTDEPTSEPTSLPTEIPSAAPQAQPTGGPSSIPSAQPSNTPTFKPSTKSSSYPTLAVGHTYKPTLFTPKNYTVLLQFNDIINFEIVIKLDSILCTQDTGICFVLHNTNGQLTHVYQNSAVKITDLKTDKNEIFMLTQNTTHSNITVLDYQSGQTSAEITFVENYFIAMHVDSSTNSLFIIGNNLLNYAIAAKFSQNLNEAIWGYVYNTKAKMIAVQAINSELTLAMGYDSQLYQMLFMTMNQAGQVTSAYTASAFTGAHPIHAVNCLVIDEPTTISIVGATTISDNHISNALIFYSTSWGYEFRAQTNTNIKNIFILNNAIYALMTLQSNRAFVVMLDLYNGHVLKSIGIHFPTPFTCTCIAPLNDYELNLVCNRNNQTVITILSSGTLQPENTVDDILFSDDFLSFITPYLYPILRRTTSIQILETLSNQTWQLLNNRALPNYPITQLLPENIPSNTPTTIPSWRPSFRPSAKLFISFMPSVANLPSISNYPTSFSSLNSEISSSPTRDSTSSSTTQPTPVGTVFPTGQPTAKTNMPNALLSITIKPSTVPTPTPFNRRSQRPTAIILNPTSKPTATATTKHPSKEDDFVFIYILIVCIGLSSISFIHYLNKYSDLKLKLKNRFRIAPQSPPIPLTYVETKIEIQRSEPNISEKSISSESNASRVSQSRSSFFSNHSWLSALSQFLDDDTSSKDFSVEDDSDIELGDSVSFASYDSGP
jgi:hypothetical protein